MHNLDRVIRFVDTYYRDVLQRPEMYVSSPDAFEDVVMVLERLVDAIEGQNQVASLGRYCEFLVEQGCGSATFLSRYKLDRQDRKPTPEELFKAYSAFLRTYLATQGRDAATAATDIPATLARKEESTS